VSTGVTLTVNGLLNTDGHDLTVNGNLVFNDSAQAILPLTANLIIGPNGRLSLASGTVLTFEQGKLDLAATATFTAQGSADNRALISSSSSTPWLGVHALGQLNLNYLAIIGAQRGLTLGDGARGTIANTQIIYNDMGVVLSGNTSAVTMQTTAIAAKPSTGSGTSATGAAAHRR
jgi:hypothetical protein